MNSLGAAPVSDHMKRRLTRVEKWVVVITLLMPVVVCGGVLAAFLASSERFRARVRDLSYSDGAKPLGYGYELFMLKSYPRHIAGGLHGTTVPQDVTSRAQEIGRYAVLDWMIVGELIPYEGSGSTQWFILDTRREVASEYSSRVAWEAALRQLSVDPASVNLSW